MRTKLSEIIYAIIASTGSWLLISVRQTSSLEKHQNLKPGGYLYKMNFNCIEILSGQSTLDFYFFFQSVTQEELHSSYSSTNASPYPPPHQSKQPKKAWLQTHTVLDSQNISPLIFLFSRYPKLNSRTRFHSWVYSISFSRTSIHPRLGGYLVCCG